jgi:hypothetical protein
MPIPARRNVSVAPYALGLGDSDKHIIFPVSDTAWHSKTGAEHMSMENADRIIDTRYWSISTTSHHEFTIVVYENVRANSLPSEAPVTAAGISRGQLNVETCCLLISQALTITATGERPEPILDPWILRPSFYGGQGDEPMLYSESLFPSPQP